MVALPIKTFYCKRLPKIVKALLTIVGAVDIECVILIEMLRRRGLAEEISINIRLQYTKFCNY